jgi:hypothetical protein
LIWTPFHLLQCRCFVQMKSLFNFFFELGFYRWFGVCKSSVCTIWTSPWVPVCCLIFDSVPRSKTLVSLPFLSYYDYFMWIWSVLWLTIIYQWRTSFNSG